MADTQKLTTLSQAQEIANAVIGKVSAKGYAVAANLGSLASKNEVAETDLASALASKINGKQDPATTLAGYGITDAYTKTEVDSKVAGAISSTYKPGGSKASVAELPTLAASVEGYVYNMTAAFTTTSDFVEGAGANYPAGTNVVVVDVDTTGETPTYKFDVLAGVYGDATQSGSGLMSASDKTKLDNADVTAYTGSGAVDITNHVVSVAAASASTSGVGGNAGTMSATDKEKLDNADVTAYTGSGAIDITNHTVSVAAAAASTSGVGGNAGTMSAADKEKLDSFTVATTSEVEAVIAALDNL